MKREIDEPWEPDYIVLKWVTVNQCTGKRALYEEKRVAAIIANAAINKAIGKDN